MKKPLLITVVIICSIAGCKIDESGLPKKQSNQLLYSKWLVKAITTISPAQGPYPELSSTETNFTADDYYLFNSDNTVKISESYPTTAVLNTRYSYVSNATGQELIFPDPNDGTNDIFVIQKLTKDSLIMSTTATVTVGTATGNTVVYPITYKLAHN